MRIKNDWTIAKGCRFQNLQLVIKCQASSSQCPFGCSAFYKLDEFTFVWFKVQCATHSWRIEARGKKKKRNIIANGRWKEMESHSNMKNTKKRSYDYSHSPTETMYAGTKWDKFLRVNLQCREFIVFAPFWKVML